jgi:acyl-coenzyme A synthetase/AMP-(fatty) acid ligase
MQAHEPGSGIDERAPDSLAQLLPLAAHRFGNAEALVGDDARWTWRELERVTRALAASLIRAGVRPGDRVAVARPKAAESVVAMHGVLRSGAVAVPVDPMAPAPAARQVLGDAAVRAVVGDMSTIAKLDPWSVDGVHLLTVIATGAVDPADPRCLAWDLAISTTDERTPLPRPAPDDAAYIIYTSGSTGRPKGILHTNASALAYVERAVETHAITAADRIGGMCPLHFDMSTLELYAGPLAGATTVVMNEAQLKFPATLAERSETERVTFWYAVPFQLRQIVERGALERRNLRSLRHVVYAGEPYPPMALRALMERLPHVAVTNAYGPAEVNVCTVHEVTAPPDDRAIPIGRSLARREGAGGGRRRP